MQAIHLLLLLIPGIGIVLAKFAWGEKKKPAQVSKVVEVTENKSTTEEDEKKKKEHHEDHPKSAEQIMAEVAEGKDGKGKSQLGWIAFLFIALIIIAGFYTGEVLVLLFVIGMVFLLQRISGWSWLKLIATVVILGFASIVFLGYPKSLAGLDPWNGSLRSESVTTEAPEQGAGVEKKKEVRYARLVMTKKGTEYLDFDPNKKYLLSGDSINQFIILMSPRDENVTWEKGTAGKDGVIVPDGEAKAFSTMWYMTYKFQLPQNADVDRKEIRVPEADT